MSKTRLNSKFLSVHARSPVKPTSYKNTVIWRWLQFVTAGQDDMGDIVRALRKRMDMNNEWANRTQMRSYILRGKAQLNPAMVERNLIHLWNLYSQYRDAEKHNMGFDPVTRGVTRNPWKEEPMEDEAASTDINKYLSR